MTAKLLFAASHVGLFGACAGTWRSADELSAACSVSATVARILADAMSSVGLLERDEDRYRASVAAEAFLRDAAQVDLRPWLRFLDEISYPHWLQFGTTVASGAPGSLDLAGDRFAVMAAGTGAFRRLHALMFAAAVDLGGRRNLLDLGGMDADFSVEAMRANPGLRTTFMYEPAACAALHDAIGAAGLTDRSEIVAVQTLEARPTAAYDVVSVTHCIHRFGAAQNTTILARAREAVEPGGLLLLIDFFLDGDARQRLLDANHAGEYLVIDGTVVYPEPEVRTWLQASRWRPKAMIPLFGGPRVLVAEAT
jgi:hypothetical protein